MSTIQRFAASLEAASAEISRPTFSTLGPPAAYDAAALTQALRSAARHMRGAFEGQEKPGKEPKPLARPRVAVVLPCHNEAAAIARVVGEFRAALPHARIIVFDNASTDATAAIAAEAGAEVHYEPRPGKGNVVRRMFADIDADIYLMADGDGTYDAASAPELIACIERDNVDMAIGARAATRLAIECSTGSIARCSAPASTTYFRATARFRAVSSRAFLPSPQASRSRRSFPSTRAN